MKTVLRWIILVWSVITIPYYLETADVYEAFFGLIYCGLIIGLMISDIREEK